MTDDHDDQDELEALGAEGDHTPIRFIGRRRLLTLGAVLAIGAAIGIGLEQFEGDDGDDRDGGGRSMRDAAARGFGPTPFLTPNASFFRIDTAFTLPTIDAAAWTISVGGLVDTPLTLTLAQLRAMPQVERTITLSCVSNEVGGDLVGTATWKGVLLSTVLTQAGVQPGAQQVFSTSVDGWTCGFPVEHATDGRDAMIALQMNGVDLPLEHGYPARLVVPGLYGYVSATKWLQKIELTTWDQQSYWIPRGWSKLGPVKLQSRIDMPRNGATLAPGRQRVAGVAWAPHTGVAKVEVRFDGGDWQPTQLEPNVVAKGSNITDAWVQWTAEWNAIPGEHSIEVRATDLDGTVQTAEVAPVAPDGATGHHHVSFDVA
jgi:DMSO/TMAO reductase YedYZ molybdopterin-dependent catalytic subunit